MLAMWYCSKIVYFAVFITEPDVPSEETCGKRTFRPNGLVITLQESRDTDKQGHNGSMDRTRGTMGAWTECTKGQSVVLWTVRYPYANDDFERVGTKSFTV